MEINKIMILMAVIIIVLAGGLFLSQKANSPTNTTENNSSETGTSTDANNNGTNTDTTPKQAGFYMSQVVTHNKEGDCWSAIGGNVYNLTDWITSHPGGKEAIIGLCGKDGTSAFQNQHGGMEKQRIQLEKFLIGALATK